MNQDDKQKHILAFVFENTDTNNEAFELLTSTVASYVVTAALEDNTLPTEVKASIMAKAGEMVIELLTEAIKDGVTYSENYTGHKAVAF